MKPKAFETIGDIKSFWNNDSSQCNLIDRLHSLIPAAGEVPDKKKNKALEKFRKASNCYYDLYNNGLCNRAAEFYKVFGFSGLQSDAPRIEERMNQIVKEAAAEQGIS